MQRQPSRRRTLLKMMARIIEQPHQQDVTTIMFSNDKVKRIILSFLISDFPLLVQVSGRWYVGFHETLKEQLEELDNRFIKAYINILSFKNSDFLITPFKIEENHKSFRWDRIIIAEVLKGFAGEDRFIDLGYCITLGFIYNKKYKCQYKFDVIDKAQQRKIWVMKEETRHNFGSIAQTSTIPTIVVGDNIKISINFFNKSKFISPDTIQFDPPIIEPSQVRECPVQRLFFDWVFYEYFRAKVEVAKFSLNPMFRMIDFKCAGIDTVAYKICYEAMEIGLIEKKKFLDIPIEVVQDGQEVITEVKRFGLASDLDGKIQLRKRDQIFLFITQGD